MRRKPATYPHATSFTAKSPPPSPSLYFTPGLRFGSPDRVTKAWGSWTYRQRGHNCCKDLDGPLSPKGEYRHWK